MNTAVAEQIGTKPLRRFIAGQHPGLVDELRELRRYGHLLGALVQRDLTVRYKRSIVGFFWTMLNPLLLMVIFIIVFSHFFRFAIPHYETYFLSEYLGWNFFAQTTIGAMASMAWNGPLMKRVRVPRTIFALATTVSGFVNLLLSFIPFLFIMIFVGAPFHRSMLFLPVSLLLLGLFTLGVALALASMSVYFADVRETYHVAVAGLMYLSPIFYPISIVPDRYRWVIAGNPLTTLLHLARAPVHEGRIPALSELLTATTAAVISVAVGWAIFRRLSRGFFSHL